MSPVIYQNFLHDIFICQDSFRKHFSLIAINTVKIYILGKILEETVSVDVDLAAPKGLNHTSKGRRFHNENSER